MASATKGKHRAAKKPKASAKRPVKARPAGKPAAKATPTEVFDAFAAPERSAPPLAEVDADVLEFIEALDRFKKQHGRPFPSWSEVLLVVRQLGYSRK